MRGGMVSYCYFSKSLHQFATYSKRPLSPLPPPASSVGPAADPAMFKNTFQSGFLSILYSIGSKPLQIWDKKGVQTSP